MLESTTWIRRRASVSCSMTTLWFCQFHSGPSPKSIPGNAPSRQNWPISHLNRDLGKATEYSFLSNGYGGVKAFQSLIGKGLNISATAVGFTNTTLMGLTFLCRPLTGSLVDYFRNIRIFLICLVLLNAFSTFSLLFLPPIKGEVEEPVSVRLQLTNSSQNTFITFTVSLNNECVKQIAGNSEIICHIVQVTNISTTHEEIIDKIQVHGFQNVDLQTLSNSSNLNVSFDKHLHSKEPKYINFSNKNQSDMLNLKCEPGVHLCKIETDNLVNEYETYQLWAFACIVLIAGLASGSITSLSDVVCCEVLGEQTHLYGRQRLFGTIGWSLSCLLSGYLSDFATGDSSKKDYSPGFYLMLCLMLMDTFILYKMPLKNELKLSTNIYRDVKEVFHSKEIVLFAIGSVLIGSLTAAIAYYELWYLQDLGASQSLLGWAIIIQCLIAEVPFFVISGWFVKKFGSFHCLVGSFAALALRFGCYSIIKNPSWALLIATTHGFTFALFQTTMANFVSVNSPKGAESTMFGIFGGLIEGMGEASGSLLCGAGFDTLGGRLTYTIASIFSGACAVIFLILSRLLTRCSERTRKESISSVNEDL